LSVVALIETRPTLSLAQEMFGYSLFFPAVLVGPQITMRHFRDFVNSHVPGTGDIPSRRYHVIPGLKAFGLGMYHTIPQPRRC
jgi:hypothetical protein